MSLFKSLKGTFQSVQHDLSAGLKSLSTSDRPATHPLKQSGPSVVNYEAGADLLQKHQVIWEDLYKSTDETATGAQNIDVEISKLYVYYDRQSELLSTFHENCASFPVIINQLQEITDSLGAVDDLLHYYTKLQEITDSLAAVDEACDKVEAALVYLENICEEQDLLYNKQAHHKQLAAYKLKKAHELEKIKIKLAREHAQKVETVNKMRQSLLRERQTAYQEQFSQDLDFYKKHGKPGRLPDTPESEKKLDLADVEIEADDSDLRDFLATAGSDPAISDQDAQDTGGTYDDTAEDNKSDSEDNIPKIEIAPEITSPLSEIDTHIENDSQETDSNTIEEVEKET